ncbi:MAG: ABC transporter permease, partial [Clostridia bacterium]|nr:ABC transporter permease [Clostridia bacterium]
MYIVKNALKCISRAKGRNILIGVIVLVIALSSCLGLSIRQAAESAKEDLLDGITVTGSITRDMSSMMDGFKVQGGAGGGFNREDFDQMLGSASALTIEDYLKYAESDKVKDFYYTVTAYLNGTDDFSPVGGSESSEGDSASGQGGMGGPPGGGKGSQMMGMNSDFTITGYSSLTAMTDFINGTSYISEGNGSVFDVTSSDFNCMISETLATYNDISVGDTVTLVNPNLETETYTFTVVAIYTSETGEGSVGGGFGGTSSSPVNRIYLSYPALKSVADLSSDNAETVTDESGRSFSSAVTASLNGTYVFANVDDYYAFSEQVYEMGLDEGYTVTSSDLNAYETSLIPLNTLSEMAGYFLIVILLIGAVILVVLN